MLGRILLGLVATAAIFLPVLLYPVETTPLRLLYAALAESLALALLLSSLPLVRAAFSHPPVPDAPEPRHDHYTRRIPVLPEKTLVPLRRIAISQPSGVPAVLSYSPDTVLVATWNKNDLLLHRRELSLTPTALFFRDLSELAPMMPPLPEREIAEYVLCGDSLFLTDVREKLTHLGVSSDRIRTEELTSAPALPHNHPSAPMRLEGMNLTRV